MNRPKLVIVLGMVVGGVACVQTNAALLNPGVSKPAICPNGVAVFTTPDKVPGKYEEVAILNSHAGSSTDEAKIIESMREKAAEVGANGIIMGGIEDPGTTDKVIAAVFKTQTERKGKSMAIFLPSDSVRVGQACAGTVNK